MNNNRLDKYRKRLEQFLIDLLDPVGRSERRYWGEVYVRGLLLDGERKSIEPMANRMPEGNVQSMQKFVGQSPWEWEPIWERLGRRMTAELEPDPVWVVDDTGFPEKESIPLELNGNTPERWERLRTARLPLVFIMLANKEVLFLAGDCICRRVGLKIKSAGARRVFPTKLYLRQSWRWP